MENDLADIVDSAEGNDAKIFAKFCQESSARFSAMMSEQQLVRQQLAVATKANEACILKLDAFKFKRSFNNTAITL